MSRRRSARQVLRTRATSAPDPEDCASFSELVVKWSDQRTRVFVIEGERLGHEDVDGSLAVRVAPKLQDLHPLVADPALAQLAVRELFHRNWNDGSITQGGEGGERSRTPAPSSAAARDSKLASFTMGACAHSRLPNGKPQNT